MITKEARRKMGWRKGLDIKAYYKNCIICGNIFRTIPSSKKQYTCSLKCRNKRREKEKIKFYCKICNKKILGLKSKNRVYCSTECKIKDLAIIRKKNFEKKRIYGKWLGYRELKKYLLEKYIKCQFCGWNIEVNILECHHKDENRKNNQETNLLLLCPNCHSLEHYKNKTGQFKNNLGKKYVSTYKEGS